MSDSILRLGTRGSQLAVTQSGWVADRITAATGRKVELVIIKTTGDRVTDRPLGEVGGKGLFTKEIEEAQLAGDVDFAVHSMKDMPTDQPPGLIFGAVPEREDARDCLVGSTLAGLASGAVVGTGSARRRAQLLRIRPDLEIRGIRGNVDTRIRLQREGNFDAVVLASAGICRLGRRSDIAERISFDDMVPAVGQGALAVQCRADDAAMLEVLATIHHAPTGICVAAERAFLIRIDGGCSIPAGAHATLEHDVLTIRGFFAVSDDDVRVAESRGPAAEAEAMGTALAARLFEPS